MDIAKEDQKYIIEKGEPGFSPRRNQAIVEGTIKKYEAMRAKKMKEFKDKVGERTEALSFYFTSPKFISSPANRYFGRRAIAYLRGDTIRNELYDNVIQMNTYDLYQRINAEKKAKRKAKAL